MELNACQGFPICCNDRPLAESLQVEISSNWQQHLVDQNTFLVDYSVVKENYIHRKIVALLSFILKCLRLLFLLLRISISFRFYGITFLFFKWKSNVAHERQNGPIPTSELYFPLLRRNTLGLTRHSHSLVESQLCSWADLPIKNSHLASVSSSR